MFKSQKRYGVKPWTSNYFKSDSLMGHMYDLMRAGDPFVTVGPSKVAYSSAGFIAKGISVLVLGLIHSEELGHQSSASPSNGHFIIARVINDNVFSVKTDIEPVDIESDSVSRP